MKKITLIIIVILWSNPLVFAQGSESEPNDTYNDANIFNLGSAITGGLGVSSDYLDWYKITTVYDGKLTFISSPESTLDTYLHLKDSDGSTQIGYTNGGLAGIKDTLTYNNLKAGTYYVIIGRNYGSYGSYSLQNIFTATSIPDGNDIELNDTYDIALTFGPNSSITGHVGFFGNGVTDYLDWYKITTVYDGKLTFVSSPESTLDTYLHLKDSDGSTQIGYTNGGIASVRDTLIYNNLKAGTYYIIIGRNYGSYGSYTLQNIFTATSIPEGNDTEPNDTYNTSLTFGLDSSITGHVGFFGYGVTDYLDWYKITTVYDGKLTFVSSPESTLDTYLELKNTNGSTQLSYTNGGPAGVRDTLSYSNLNAGTYYIIIGRNSGSYGSYTLQSFFEALTGINENFEDKAHFISSSYPNPFSSNTVIYLQLETYSETELIIYNSIGQKIAEPFKGKLNPGNHQFAFDATGLNPGIYYYKFVVDGLSTTKSMILMK